MSATPSVARVQLAWPLQVLLWTGANSLAGAAVGLAVSALEFGTLEPPLVWISVLFGNVVGFTVLVTSQLLFPRLGGLPPLARAASLGLALVSGALGGTALVVYLFPLFILRDIGQLVAIAGVNSALALALGGVVYVYEGLRRRLAEALREIEQVRLAEARLREQAARAELAALQARIRPHFLFNTLNTIASLLEEDPAAAERLVERLAELFRYALHASAARPVRLEEELRFVEGYLAIERARFGERLRVRWDIEPAAREFAVPGLLLQPLVENAVAHGIAPVPGGGTVLVRAKLHEEDLELEVEDDGAGVRPAESALWREGHGLDNVRQRLAALYGGRAAIAVESRPGRGTRVRLRLPARPARALSETR